MKSDRKRSKEIEKKQDKMINEDIKKYCENLENKFKKDLKDMDLI